MSDNKPKIHLVVGARPNYIKANPVYQTLEELNQFDLKLINTGQHYDHNMSSLFFDELGMKSPDIDLEVGSGRHGEQTAKIMERYEKILYDDTPDLVIVFGDVNSTIACSLAAVKLHITTAHVEAGLRSFDRTMPEEINRILTDQISNLLFITCPDAADNLTKEGISEAKIHFVGNTMIDSLVQFLSHFERSSIQEKLGVTKPYALMTFHRPSNVDDEINLVKLVRALEETTTFLNCIFPIHPRTRKMLKEYGLLDALKSNPRFFITEPIGYTDFMCLQKNADIVLTDSGGIQEESTFFGVPCLTIRDNTERPITITQGTNKVIGTSYDNIPTEVESVLSEKIDTNRCPELWDGKSAKRISKIISTLFI